MPRTTLLIAWLAVTAAMAAADPAAESPAPADTLIAFTIPDQFDAEHTDDELRGRVAVLLWADRDGSDHLPRWRRMLERSLEGPLASGEVALRTVAHGRGVPGFVKGMVKGSFPDDPAGWALMDWEGVFADAYAPTEDHLNVLVFDAGGRLVHRAAVTGLAQAPLDGMVAAVRAAALDDGPPGVPSGIQVESE